MWQCKTCNSLRIICLPPPQHYLNPRMSFTGAQERMWPFFLLLGSSVLHLATSRDTKSPCQMPLPDLSPITRYRCPLGVSPAVVSLPCCWSFYQAPWLNSYSPEGSAISWLSVLSHLCPLCSRPEWNSSFLSCFCFHRSFSHSRVQTPFSAMFVFSYLSVHLIIVF